MMPAPKASVFGLFAVFSAVFCTLEPLKVQLKTCRRGCRENRWRDLRHRLQFVG